MTATADLAPTGPARRGTSFRVGVVVLAGSALLLVLAVTMLALRVAPTIGSGITAASRPLPVRATMALEPGTWVVFEQTGTRTRNGPVTTTSTTRPTLTPDDVTVSDASGRALPTTVVTSNQTLTRQGTVYTGVVSFDVPTAGSYQVAVSSGGAVAGAEVIVGRDLGSGFASGALWFLAAMLALLGCGVGALLMFIGRRRTPPPASGPTASRPWAAAG